MYFSGDMQVRRVYLDVPHSATWVKEHMRKENEEVISGSKTGFTPHSSCQMAGVPMFMGYGGGRWVYP